MNLDLFLILNILTVATGLVWLMDMLFLNPQRRKSLLETPVGNATKKSGTKDAAQINLDKEPIYVEYSKALFPLLLIIFIFRSFSASVDYGLVLVIATAVTGLIWLIDKLAFEAKRKKAFETLQQKNQLSGEALPEEALSEEIMETLGQDPLIVEYAKSFFPLILFILVLRSFLFEPFKIPSGSMKPTLEIGDFVLVNKFSYGIRLPVTNQKIFSISDPERGDVFVFRFPLDPRIDYIKRVIGLPGDTIVYRDKQIYIQPACESVSTICPGPEKVKTTLLARNGYHDLNGDVLDLVEEDLMGVKHQILHDPRVSDYQMMQHFNKYCMNGHNTWKVPPGHYFAMGDNREHSSDSRVWCFMPEENLVGKAVAIWMHWNSDEKYKVDFSRIGGID